MKEVGIYLVGCPTIARKVESYFNNLWKLASLDSSAHTKTVSDQQWQINRTVPCWSNFLDPKERCRYEISSIDSIIELYQESLIGMCLYKRINFFAFSALSSCKWGILVKFSHWLAIKLFILFVITAHLFPGSLRPRMWKAILFFQILTCLIRQLRLLGGIIQAHNLNLVTFPSLHLR